VRYFTLKYLPRIGPKHFLKSEYESSSVSNFIDALVFIASTCSSTLGVRLAVHRNRLIKSAKNMILNPKISTCGGGAVSIGTDKYGVEK
jgi:uncharacterized PurR-regulated membrane protein YhhQ (DUF165 family)